MTIFYMFQARTIHRSLTHAFVYLFHISMLEHHPRPNHLLSLCASKRTAGSEALPRWPYFQTGWTDSLHALSSEYLSLPLSLFVSPCRPYGNVKIQSLSAVTPLVSDADSWGCNASVIYCPLTWSRSFSSSLSRRAGIVLMVGLSYLPAPLP